MNQFQVIRNKFTESRVVNVPSAKPQIADGEVLVKVEKFAYTANNITYAVAGDMLSYWNFFPALGEGAEDWGVIPVWGFAKVVESSTEGIPVGERLFGYFPPSDYLVMRPMSISEQRFIDGSEHRLQLPAGYNLYRRVNGEADYNKAMDNQRMVLFPLHLTSFCLWDVLKDKDWFGAKQVLVLSASSKTSVGLGYALQSDTDSPTSIGVTSKRNLEIVEKLNIYEKSFSYDNVKDIDSNLPSVIVDMSGNAEVLNELCVYLGNNMKYCINVGLTHWGEAGKKDEMLKERSEFFFAPSHIQKRLKDWGAEEFDKKSASFLVESSIKTSKWLNFEKVEGLQALAEIHKDVCDGNIAADIGLIVEM